MRRLDTVQLERVCQEGHGAYLAGRYEEAAKHIGRVANADPEHVKARIKLGRRSGPPSAETRKRWRNSTAT